VAEWTSRDARLKASVVVPFEDGAASARMIEARCGDANFAQVLLLTRTAEPLGQRRYWPIYQAAVAAGLPVGIHAFGYGGSAMTSGGWPSYYIEEMVGHAQCQQAVLTSLIFEGVFERFPTLKVVLVEAGFAWAPAHAWRMDRHFAKLRHEVPHVKRLPSEYMRTNVWFTTQPVEEPEPRAHLADAIAWMGWDRVLFATDYPHWDYDDPSQALPIRMSETQKQGIFLENARAVYGFR
jgi:predicted TIM-barrel fold metal-dependent hydrolase